MCVLALFPAAITFAQQDAPVIVATADATVTRSEMATVDVSLDTGSSTNKIGAFTLTMSYDDSIIMVTDCQLSDYNGICNSSVPGIIRLTGIDTGGLGNKSIAATLTVEGVATGSTTIELTDVPSLSDTSGQPLDYTLADGQVDVVEPATPTPTPTNTPTPTATSTSTPTPTATSTPIPTSTPTAVSTSLQNFSGGLLESPTNSAGASQRGIIFLPIIE